MLNCSFPTLPNCMYILLSSYSSMSQKFLTLALSTRPLKFSTNAYTYSFHFGGLLKKNIISSVSLSANFPWIVSFSTSVSAHPISWPSLFTIGSNTFILLGPLDPSTLVSYQTTPYQFLASSLSSTFFGFSLESKRQNSVPKKLDLTLPRYPFDSVSNFFCSIVIMQLDVEFIPLFFPVSKYLLPFDRDSVYFGNRRSKPDLDLVMVHWTCPIRAGNGFMYKSRSSSSGRYGFKSLLINASYASF